jgi:hypothetical protein
MPRRITLSRRKGWRIPEGTLIVSRPSEFGSPFRIGERGVPDAATALRKFKAMLRRPQAALARDPRLRAFTRASIRARLRGRNLACWCAQGAPCHAEVLLRIANAAR